MKLWGLEIVPPKMVVGKFLDGLLFLVVGKTNVEHGVIILKL